MLRLLSLSALLLGAATPFSLATAVNSTNIKWIDCPEDKFGPLPSIECGQLMVPLDHDKPDGDRIRLVFTRLKAKGKDTLGPLFLNGGGPGMWTSNLVKAQASYEKTGKEVSHNFSPQIREKYDLIGLDMRGGGLSQEIYCNPEYFNAPHEMLPTTDKAFEQLVKRNRGFAESCYNMTGPFFNHIGTNQVVKDLDLLRQALGAEKFNYFGYSYGTEVGSWYASRYPDKVGHVVLDGNLDHSMTVPQAFMTMATGLEDTIEYFFKWCNTTDDNALYGQDQHAIWDGILKHADEGTLVAAECEKTKSCKSPISAEEFIFAAQSAGELGNVKKPIKNATSNFYVLADALHAARNGNGSVFASPYITSNSSADPVSGQSFSFMSIFCSDWVHTIQTPGDMRALVEAAKVLAPRTRGAGTMGIAHSNCVGWPYPSSFHQRRLDFTGAKDLPEILIVGSLHDEATAMQWSVQQRWQIPNSLNIWRNGGGHTDYHFMGDTQRAIDNYLIHGKVPKDGTVYES